ncbi:hypothetical protein AAG570_001340 [Ranatra chinensis]|uniref:PHLPP-like RA domain-containing protein n=1 Tax=Ranatra chinensis TaxID=642074 RepID=A0ABD0YQE2_9HEMI
MVYEPARVRVGERCGWVRVVTEPGPTWPPGTLVYLAQDTQVTAICQDLVLPSNYTIWLQYGGGDGRCLEDTEKPLAIQDQFLTSLGYSDYSRRARLGIDPDLRFLITFYIGPRCTTYGGPGGSAYLLKGLVVPQWRRREISIIGNVMFIHPVEGSKVEMEKVDLDGAEVESSPNSKCGRNVLRVSGKNRQVFLGFDQPWERQFWHYWLIQVCNLPSL